MNIILVEFIPAPGGRGSFCHSFYTLADATAAAEGWINLVDCYACNVWNGETWTRYGG